LLSNFCDQLTESLHVAFDIRASLIPACTDHAIAEIPEYGVFPSDDRRTCRWRRAIQLFSCPKKKEGHRALKR
jgi:hypothetical protein